MNYNLNIPGWTSERELVILSTLASLVPENGGIVEVGCFLGRSTTALYTGKKQSVSMDIIDNFNNSGIPKTASYEKIGIEGNIDIYNRAASIAQETTWQDAFKFTVGEDLFNNINIHCMDSKDFVKTKDCDLAFIDGSHRYVNVITDIKKHMTDTNLILGDDFKAEFPGVSQALSVYKQDRTVIVFEKTKLWALVPAVGYWRDVFKENNLLFL